MGRSNDGQVIRWTSGERQVNVKSQSELNIGGRKTFVSLFQFANYFASISKLLKISKELLLSEGNQIKAPELNLKRSIAYNS